MEVYSTLERLSGLPLGEIRAALSSLASSSSSSSSSHPNTSTNSSSSSSSTGPSSDPSVLRTLAVFLQDRFLDTLSLRCTAYLWLDVLATLGSGPGAHYVLYATLQAVDRLASAPQTTPNSSTSSSSTTTPASSVSNDPSSSSSSTTTTPSSSSNTSTTAPSTTTSTTAPNSSTTGANSSSTSAASSASLTSDPTEVLSPGPDLTETLFEEWFLLTLMTSDAQPLFAEPLDAAFKRFSRPMLDELLARIDANTAFQRFVEKAEAEKAHSLMGFDAAGTSPFLLLGASHALHRQCLTRKQLAKMSFMDEPNVSSSTANANPATSSSSSSSSSSSNTANPSSSPSVSSSSSSSAATTGTAGVNSSSGEKPRSWLKMLDDDDASFFPGLETSVATHWTLDEAMQAPALRPSWLTLLPPIMDPLPNEAIWTIAPAFAHVGLWDDNVPPEPKDNRVASSELLKRAYKQTLLPAHAQQLIDELDAAFAKKHALPAASVPELVEHNPNVATQLLKVWFESDTKTAEAALEHVVKMPMSLHVVEVVNRLSTAIAFPRGLLFSFLQNCTVACERTPDTYMQNRLVRLLCVLVQSLLRNRVFAVSDVAAMMQPFCAAFSRVSDAAKLYEVLTVKRDD